MLPIIDRYILREASKSFLAILTVLMLIVVSQSYISILEDAASGIISNEVLMRLLGLEVLQVLGPVAPPTFFFSILYTLGRMYRDSEMTALAAGGVGTFRVFRSFLLMALPVTALVAWLTISLLPWVNQNKEETIQSQQDESAELGTAVAGRFNEFSQGDLLFYVESISDDKSRMRNIFIQNRKHGKLGLVTAAEGYQYVDKETGGLYLVLNDGYRYEGSPGNSAYTVGDYEKYAIRIGEGKKAVKALPPKALPSGYLMRSEKISELSEFQYRLIFPTAIIVFTILCVPLSKSLPREGIYGSLMLAILFYFIFLNLQAVSGNWMVAGITPVWLGRWWVHPFMLTLGGLVILYKSHRFTAAMASRFRGKRP
ncbi:LPS export ABC transporter permease LptF [Candidatus Vondammii sp. HM_W22]|uniref:LPS export ABC transporter permease LptF n=1 Tax=Candidatus Vondammii sp. HM_W22 TaxID=2687299 RepID=UPI001F135124|nr:LPS export ABC transporter permease LptF [Candidatus Vondammii sp. HM_W22]